MAFNWADITNPQGSTRTPWNWANVSAPQTGAQRKPFGDLLSPSGGAKSVTPTPAPSLGGQRFVADRLDPMANAPMGPSPEEAAQAWIQEMLGLAYGGGGGANLSGYNELISDIDARQAALDKRRGEQQAFLTALFDAAEARAAADKAGIAGNVTSQLQADALRRAQDVSIVRDQEAARRIVADAARGALGVTPGADLSSEISQNTAGQIVAGGTVADRDARIQQSIAEQQLAREISGLTPMEAMYTGDLMRQYEDRLSALASERAGIRAQMAQARASAGRRSPSINDLLTLQEAANQQFGLGGAGAVELPEILQTTQGLQGAFGTAYNDVMDIANQVITSMEVNPATGKVESPNQTLARLSRSNPAIQSFLKQYREATPAIVNYVTQALKG